MSSCSNFPERLSSYELEHDKPVLQEIKHLKRKIGEGDFESLRAVLNRNSDIFSKHKADIDCCNFIEHKIELEEGAVPHREGSRRMTPHKSEACRAEIEKLLEYDMIEHSKSSWACGVVMPKKGGQLRFCCDFRYVKAVTIKDAYPIPRINESLSKLGDAKFFIHWTWVLPSGRSLCGGNTERRPDSHVNWSCTSGRGCPSACATQRPLFKD